VPKLSCPNPEFHCLALVLTQTHPPVIIVTSGPESHSFGEASMQLQKIRTPRLNINV
jgi:hypothetical protein